MEKQIDIYLQSTDGHMLNYSDVRVHLTQTLGKKWNDNTTLNE